MSSVDHLEIFLVSVPGLEDALRAEAAEKGFRAPVVEKGGVTVRGGWSEIWRANLQLRGASKVLVRIGEFRTPHLAQLDKRMRRFPWVEFLRLDVPVRVEVSCKRSRIYHSGAAAERVEKALKEGFGVSIERDAEICVKVRIHNDLCTISLDTSGEGLHKRGHKEAVNKAPMRETMAALFLRQCGFNGAEPVVDPMCGAGTFVIEAAEIAAGLVPGRSRHFAFERFAGFDEAAWRKMRDKMVEPVAEGIRFYGSDRDAGAVQMSRANAERAGVSALTEFREAPISGAMPPSGPPGLVIVNPPYGGRIGNPKRLFPLYKSLGQTLMEQFAGWRVGLITSKPSLAKATGLSFVATGEPVSHGGLTVKLYTTGALSPKG